MGERADGKWAALECGLIVPRQNGKGAVFEALELAWLFLFGDRLVLHTAHELKTSLEAFLRLLFLIESTPDLDRRVMRVVRTNGKEGIELRGGQRIKFIARSRGSGRGLSGDKIVLDEAYELLAKAVAAMLPTLSARENPQVWYGSSHPLDDDVSEVLRRLMRRGRAGDPNLAYMEYAAGDDLDDVNPADDEAVWEAVRAANPNFGARLNREVVEMERRAMEWPDFARERLGLVDLSESEAGWRVIPHRRWIACEDKLSEVEGEAAFALDVSPDREWASFCVAGASTHGGVHLELVDRMEGTEAAVARAVALHAKWGKPIALAKGSPAWSLKETLEEAGVEVRAVTLEENAQACGDLFDAVKSETVRHLGDPVLDEAVKRVDRRPYNDTWLWSRRNSSADISALVAATLARWVFLHDSVAAEPPVYAY